MRPKVILQHRCIRKVICYAGSLVLNYYYTYVPWYLHRRPTLKWTSQEYIIFHVQKTPYYHCTMSKYVLRFCWWDWSILVIFGHIVFQNSAQNKMLLLIINRISADSFSWYPLFDSQWDAAIYWTKGDLQLQKIDGEKYSAKEPLLSVWLTEKFFREHVVIENALESMILWGTQGIFVQRELFEEPFAIERLNWEQKVHWSVFSLKCKDSES